MTSTDGMVLVDKPAGMTSHDVVSIVKRAVGASRAGHAGTLDPFATGLLVVLLGRATRLAPHVPGEPKEYVARIAFGMETDTDDMTGISTRHASLPAASEVIAALPAFTGQLQQVPPAFSAKQVGGQRAYRAARGGAPLELAPVTVTVHGWSSLRYDGEGLDATISCAGGTYIRALARDLGRASGSAAHLAALRRTRSGPHRVADAFTLDQVRMGLAEVRDALAVVPQLERRHLSSEAYQRVCHGGAVPVEEGDSSTSEWAALVAPDGSLSAVARRTDDRWQPTVVLSDA